MSDGRLARALYTNTPETKNELFFRKGDVLTVLEIDHDGQPGWWLCSLHGNRGICPGNYLELIEDKYSFVEKRASNALDDPMDAYDVPRAYKPEGNVEVNPLDFYDTPRTITQTADGGSSSLKNLKNTASASSILSTDSSNFLPFSSSSSSGVSSARNSACSDNPNGSRSENLYVNECQNDKVVRQSNSSLKQEEEKRLSIQSEANLKIMSAVAAIQELYDVPRSAPSSRVHSAMSMSSGLGQSIATSESKDSLDSCDVNGGAGGATYVNCFEDYDVPRSVIRSRPGSMHSQKSLGSTLTRKDQQQKEGSHNNAGDAVSELYDVPRSHQPVLPRKTAASLASLPISATSGKRFNPRDFSRSEVELRRHGFIHQSNGGGFSTETLTNDKDHQSASCVSLRLPRKDSGSSVVSNGTVEEEFSKSINRPRASFRTSGAGSSFWGSSASLDRRSSNFDAISDAKVLPLKPRAAVTVCEKLRQEVLSSVKAMMDFVRPKWRTKENLAEIMPDFKFSAIRLNLATKDMVDFCSRCLSNAKKYSNKSTVLKLQRLLTALVNGSQIVQRDVDELEAYFWSPDRLSIPPDAVASPNDALEQLVLCASSLSHDVTEISNFLISNSSNFFLDLPPPAPSPPSTLPSSSKPQTSIETNGAEEDYDYVSLVPVDNNGSDNLSTTTDTLSDRDGACSPQGPVLDPFDLQLLEFYTEQVTEISPLLSQAIGAFISSIQRNDPPKLFNAHLKYVVLLSYKMLFAGDTIHRNMTNQNLKEEIENKSNDLHKSIVSLHEASRAATREFPKIPPMQTIVDRVYSTTAAATQLKKFLVESTPTL